MRHHGVDTRVVWLGAVEPPARHTDQTPPAVHLTDQRSPRVSLARVLHAVREARTEHRLRQFTAVPTLLVAHVSVYNGSVQLVKNAALARRSVSCKINGNPVKDEVLPASAAYSRGRGRGSGTPGGRWHDRMIEENM